MNTRRETPPAGGQDPQEPLPGSDGFTAGRDADAELDHADADYAAQQILGANPLIGFDRGEIIDGLK